MTCNEQRIETKSVFDLVKKKWKIIFFETFVLDHHYRQCETTVSDPLVIITIYVCAVTCFQMENNFSFQQSLFSKILVFVDVEKKTTRIENENDFRKNMIRIQN